MFNDKIGVIFCWELLYFLELGFMLKEFGLLKINVKLLNN